MSKSIYLTGSGPGSGKSVVLLGVMELLARHGRKLGIFRPVVEGEASADNLIALVTHRYGITTPSESTFGVAYATLRDLISKHKVPCKSAFTGYGVNALYQFPGLLPRVNILKLSYRRHVRSQPETRNQKLRNP